MGDEMIGCALVALFAIAAVAVPVACIAGAIWLGLKLAGV